MAKKKSREIDFEYYVVDGQKAGAQTLSLEQTKKDYLEVLYYQTKQRDGLLGEFDENGKYAIRDEKILQSLLLVPKKFEEKVENVVYASAQKNNIVLNFKIEFDLNVDYSSACLYLIEVEHGVEEDTKLLTKIDDYLSINTATFVQDVLKSWKVWKDAEVYEKNDFLFEYLRFQNEEFLFNKELTEILAQLYIVRLLSILDASGELGQKVLSEYKLLIEKIQEKDPAFKQSYTNLKRLLDHVLIKNGAMDLIVKTQEAAAIVAAYSNPIKRIKDKKGVTLKEASSESEPEKKKEDSKPVKKTEQKKAKKAKAKSSSPKLYKFDASKAFKGGSVGGYTLPKVTPPKAVEKPQEVPKPEKKTSKPIMPVVEKKPELVSSSVADKFLQKQMQKQRELIELQIIVEKKSRIQPNLEEKITPKKSDDRERVI